MLPSILCVLRSDRRESVPRMSIAALPDGWNSKRTPTPSWLAHSGAWTQWAKACQQPPSAGSSKLEQEARLKWSRLRPTAAAALKAVEPEAGSHAHELADAPIWMAANVENLPSEAQPFHEALLSCPGACIEEHNLHGDFGPFRVMQSFQDHLDSAAAGHPEKRCLLSRTSLSVSAQRNGYEFSRVMCAPLGRCVLRQLAERPMVILCNLSQILSSCFLKGLRSPGSPN